MDRETLAAHSALLVDEGEIGLVRKLTEYPRMIEAAAQTLEPHRIAFYLYELASAFHAHWNRGTENVDLRFVKVTDRESTYARLGLVQAVSDVISSGLALPELVSSSVRRSSLSPFAPVKAKAFA